MNTCHNCGDQFAGEGDYCPPCDKAYTGGYQDGVNSREEGAQEWVTDANLTPDGLKALVQKHLTFHDGNECYDAVIQQAFDMTAGDPEFETNRRDLLMRNIRFIAHEIDQLADMVEGK